MDSTLHPESYLAEMIAATDQKTKNPDQALLPLCKTEENTFVNGAGEAVEDATLLRFRTQLPSDGQEPSMTIEFPSGTTRDQSDAILASIKPVVDSSRAHPKFVKQVCGWCDCSPAKAGRLCRSRGVNSLFRYQMSTIYGVDPSGEVYSDELEALLAIYKSVFDILIKDYRCTIDGILSWEPWGLIEDEDDLCGTSRYFGHLFVKESVIYRSGPMVLFSSMD